MAKRFTCTDIWEEDWFIQMPMPYQMFWFFVKDRCDQAGIFKVNVEFFNALFKSNIESDKALEYFNKGKERIRKVNGSCWLIEDFFKFQYGQNLNLNNRVHQSIERIYSKLGVNLRSIRGLNEVKDRVKDKDKEKDKDIVS